MNQYQPQLTQRQFQLPRWLTDTVYGKTYSSILLYLSILLIVPRECGFGMEMEATTPSSIPSTKPEFLKAVKGELTTISFVKAGLSRYLAVLNSGEHQVFSQAFLESQNKATEITFKQLDQIKEHLYEIEAELGAGMESEAGENGHEEKVRVELLELFGHAKPWVARTRAVMVSSHVFYKVNYALAADARKETK